MVSQDQEKDLHSVCEGRRGNLSLFERQQDKACTYPVPGTGPLKHQQGWPRHGERKKGAGACAGQDPHPIPVYQGGSQPLLLWYKKGLGGQS